ncbi:caspase domain-containing protein [Armillaria borealis]|uniref:Caspase domain-containing protein n=1 Tax=Armillaria borealis TaxID=47425 RepID=A0AA39J773_9AGAR|nr:caspase domain-containing protein [Armillaria borealis]
MIRRYRLTLPVELEARPLPQFVDASRFWVVLIGIDQYAHYPLRGCVSDALLMQKYFIEDLRVPWDRIQLLLGSREHISCDDPMNPSRIHIIHALLGIITNPDVEYGDNIIIYFSGHGSYYQCPEFDDDESGEPGYVEALCPIDRDTPDDNGKPIPDISDHEFNAILTQIFRAKGHRITVILDCCHSASVSRDLPEPEARVTPVTKRATLEDMLLAGESYTLR